jgi:hypothetical protein
VENRRGPAAVTGDETCKSHCFSEGRWEGAGSRKNRKSEDLPE